MKKKTNLVKRNSGFIIGCVLAAGASFFTADMVMSNQLSLLTPSTEEPDTETAATVAPETETTGRVYETDPFTVTASGNIIKGVETEAPTERDESEPQTDENGNVIPETDADGNPITSTGETDADGNLILSGDGNTSGDGSGSSDGSSGDGSYSQDGSYSDGSSGQETYYEQPVEVYDSDNSNYYYTDNSGSGSSDSSGSSGGSGSSDSSGSSGGSDSSGGSGGSDNSSAWTPDDVIISGISSRYIDESELYNYDEGQLRLIRNEIFALHGRIFRSQDLADYFSQKSWYVPTYDPDEFDANMFYYLNDYEEANLQVILNYEAALAGN